MADLNDGVGSADSSIACDERRGCKRSLEDKSSETNDASSASESREFNSRKTITDLSPDTIKKVKGNETIASGDSEIEESSNSNRDTGFLSDLPHGMSLQWNNDKSRAVLNIAETSSDTASTDDRELRVCVVGRARIRVEEGSVEILGHTLDTTRQEKIDGKPNDCDTDLESPFASGVVITSPYWSSWMTIEANPLCLPCKVILECIRGPESFKIMPPKRPILLPELWKNCADVIVQDFCKSSNTSDSSNRSRGLAMMADSLEDIEDGMNEKCHTTDGTRRVCMITGAKGVGKSTMLRYLTNRILSARSEIEEIAILDTDVGQPELAPPGLLTLSIVRKPLLQPPYWNLVNEIVLQKNEEHDNQAGEQHGSVHGPQQEHFRSDKCDEEHYETNAGVGIETVSSVFFGAATSKVDPTRYITSIQFLMRQYETEVVNSSESPIPLLINMDGWVKGLGYQILTTLINSLGPTHLVQILGDTPGQTFDLPSSVCDSPIVDDNEVPSKNPSTSANTVCAPKIFEVQACQTMSGVSLCKIPASTMRNFRWATYFLPNELQTFDAWDFVSADLLQTGWIAATNSDKTTTVPHWWPNDNKNSASEATENGDDDEGENDDSELSDDGRLATALARERPYCVPMEAVEAFVIGSDFEDYLRVPASEKDIDTINRTYDRIFRALNGCIVALCTNTVTMECLGYGILRSIDYDKRLLYVLVSPSVFSRTMNPLHMQLSSVKALVGGSLPLPLAMLYRGVYAESFPYLTFLSSRKILGSEPMKSRNNIARRGLINAKRNAN